MMMMDDMGALIEEGGVELWLIKGASEAVSDTVPQPIGGHGVLVAAD
jgi:hypothetical protein